MFPQQTLKWTFLLCRYYPFLVMCNLMVNGWQYSYKFWHCFISFPFDRCWSNNKFLFQLKYFFSYQNWKRGNQSGEVPLDWGRYKATDISGRLRGCELVSAYQVLAPTQPERVYPDVTTTGSSNLQGCLCKEWTRISKSHTHNTRSPYVLLNIEIWQSQLQ